MRFETYVAFRYLRGKRKSRFVGLITVISVAGVSVGVVALIVGVLALVRFYSRKNDTLLLIGSAMIGVAVLDTYHLFVTTGVPFPLMPADHAATEPWSWPSR